MTPAAAATRSHAIHQTPLGPLASTWSTRGLLSLRWETDLGLGGHDTRADQLDRCLDQYFRGGHADFSWIDLDTSGWTEFTGAVYRCCRTIPAGTTISYKDLARCAGRPAASRAVGAAMSRNRCLLVIPCHRVVSTGGGLRGFSAPGGLQTKRFLLDLESR